MDHLTRVIRRCHGLIALGLLVMMFVLGLTSMAGNSAIVDEVAHIPAAYSYLHFGDYRLNPEHPPLIKDMASLPLQFMHLNFPDKPSDPYTTEVNGQWDTGWQFLYHSGNDADAILFWARLPILLLSIAFGAFLYLWTKRKFGVATALITLFFYTLSPNIIAHSLFVTTDLGATAFMFVAVAAYLHYSQAPSRQRLALLGLAIAVAELAKFSSILLYPFLLIMATLQTYAWRRPERRADRAKTYILGLVGASVMSLGVIWIVYGFQTIHLTQSVQQKLIEGSLTTGAATEFVKLLVAMSHHALLRPLGQYLLGLLMVFGRVAGGNTTYLLGHITAQSYHYYFPVLFVYKTQIAFLIFGLTAIIVGVRRMVHRTSKLKVIARRLMEEHFIEVTLGGFALFYFAISMVGNLNLGIRHILPIYPPLFVIVAIFLTRFLHRLRATRWRRAGAVLFIVLMGWYGAATVWVYPSFTAYFNEFMGGPSNAGDYFSDSSVDWGQDLIRLRTYMADHHIQTYAVDYFGGGELRYYLPDTKHVIEWHSQNGRYPGQYIAVSETYLENDRYYAAEDNRTGEEYLRAMKPYAEIGYSIYVYKLY